MYQLTGPRASTSCISEEVKVRQTLKWCRKEFMASPRSGPASFHFQLQLALLDPGPADKEGASSILRTSAENRLLAEEHDGSVVIIQTTHNYIYQ